jgi:hypothetical protein
VTSHLPVGVHVTSDLGVFEHLASTFRWRRWRYRRRWRWTGTTRQQNGKKSQRQHAFPKIVHRTTRDEWKSNSRDRTDHGRPDHSFFIAETPASASESAGPEGYGCRFCVGISEGRQAGTRFCQTGRLREQARSHIGIECRQQEIGRLADRHREQAHSYSWNEYICKKQVGCQAAFASRLTPTVGMSTSARNRSAVRPPSRAGSLLQLE